MSRYRIVLFVTLATSSVLLIGGATLSSAPRHEAKLNRFDRTILENAQRSLAEGRETFRFDTFGDEDFWEVVESLKDAGAEGILVVAIDQMIQ